MLRAFGAALAAVLIATPAGATVYSLSGSATFEITDYHGNHYDELRGNRFLTSFSDFGDVVLSQDGDIFNYTATYVSPVPATIFSDPEIWNIYDLSFKIGGISNCGKCFVENWTYPQLPDKIEIENKKNAPHYYDGLLVRAGYSTYYPSGDVTAFELQAIYIGTANRSFDINGLRLVAVSAPEPSTWMMLLLGLPAVGLFKARRQLSAFPRRHRVSRAHGDVRK